MKSIKSLAHLPEPPDPDEAKYSLVMHGLCKKYGVADPLGRHVLSIIENMSRHGRLCLYPPEKLTEYSGGKVEDVESVLSQLENRSIIKKGKMKSTDGWKLEDRVRRSADFLKEKIDRLGKDRRSHN